MPVTGTWKGFMSWPFANNYMNVKWYFCVLFILWQFEPLYEIHGSENEIFQISYLLRRQTSMKIYQVHFQSNISSHWLINKKRSFSENISSPIVNFGEKLKFCKKNLYFEKNLQSWKDPCFPLHSHTCKLKYENLKTL